MADFLTSITQRTLGLLPVVQPIIASKYVSEATGAATPGALTLLDPFTGQVAEEPSEHWEGLEEQLPPAPLARPVVPRAAPMSTTAVPGVSPSLATPQEHPSTSPAQQTAPAPVRPQAVQSARETTGGNPSSPLVPQPQTSLVRNESLPLAGRSPVDNRSPVRKDAPPVTDESLEIVASHPQSGDSPENQPFSSASTAATVPTTKPRRGQSKPSPRTAKSMGSTPLVHTQSGEIAAKPQLPQAGAQGVPRKSSVEQQHISPPTPASEESSPHASIQATVYNEINSALAHPYTSSFKSASPTLVSSSLPVPANTSGSPPGNRRNIAHARPTGQDSTQGEGQRQPDPQPGRGQAGPLPYTKYDTSDPYRVRAGLAPALVAPTLVAPALRAESDLVEPLLPAAYPPVQSRRMGTSTAGRRADAQLSETPAAPTIRVTIGRIDVRAVNPTPPPVSPAPVRAQRSQPALSLDDYLKQRNGG